MQDDWCGARQPAAPGRPADDPTFAYECNKSIGHSGKHQYHFNGQTFARWEGDDRRPSEACPHNRLVAGECDECGYVYGEEHERRPNDARDEDVEKAAKRITRDHEELIKRLGTNDAQFAAAGRASGDPWNLRSEEAKRADKAPEPSTESARTTTCAYCGQAEGHSKRCAVTRLGVEEQRAPKLETVLPGVEAPLSIVDTLGATASDEAPGYDAMASMLRGAPAETIRQALIDAWRAGQGLRKLAPRTGEAPFEGDALMVRKLTDAGRALVHYVDSLPYQKNVAINEMMRALVAEPSGARTNEATEAGTLLLDHKAVSTPRLIAAARKCLANHEAGQISHIDWGALRTVLKEQRCDDDPTLASSPTSQDQESPCSSSAASPASTPSFGEEGSRSPATTSHGLGSRSGSSTSQLDSSPKVPRYTPTPCRSDQSPSPTERGSGQATIQIQPGHQVHIRNGGGHGRVMRGPFWAVQSDQGGRESFEHENDLRIVESRS